MERKIKSSPVWVEYKPEGATHAHLLLLADGNPLNAFNFSGEDIEDAAAELAEGVARCNEERHRGHGQTHTTDDIRNAYSTAVTQLLTVDYGKAWEEVKRQIRRWQKWQGPVPEAVFFPDEHDPKGPWKMVVTDAEGNPSVHNVPQEFLGDVMPGPEEMGARPNPNGGGWLMPPKRKKRGHS